MSEDAQDRYTLRQIFTFAQLNNWYNMSDEEREKEVIEARMLSSKDKPLTRENLIATFTQGDRVDIVTQLS